MYSRFYAMIYAGVLVLGLWWCKEILGRFRTDCAELKEPDNARRAVIIGMWVATAIIIAAVVNFAGHLIGVVVHAFR